MAETLSERRIGVTSLLTLDDRHGLMPSIKRASLLFDQLSLVDLEVGLQDNGLWPNDREQLVWLAETEVLVQSGPVSDPDASNIAAVGDYFRERAMSISKRDYPDPDDLRVARLIMLLEAVDAQSFAVAYDQERKGGVRAIPLLANPRPRPRPESSSETVLGIVVEALPAPSADTPWQAILDFRADQEARAAFLRLRNWMNKMGREPRGKAEIVDELRMLLSEYAQHMKFHRLKTERSVLEGLVVGSAELFEDLAKLRFGSAAKAIFTIEQRKIALMEAERSAPGREVAYIARAHEQLLSPAATTKVRP